MSLYAVQIERQNGYQFPLEFLDQIIELKPDVSIIGKKNVSMNEPYFQGHFPDNPVMPGVLIIEAMTQAAQIMFDSEENHLSKIKKARFRKMVRPGDQLIIKVNKKEATSNVCEAKALVDDEVACSAELTLS